MLSQVLDHVRLHPIKFFLDPVLGLGGVSFGLWFQWVHSGATLVASLGGAVLVVLRIYQAIGDLRAQRDRLPTDDRE
jgi:hypothetical protein